MKVVLLVLATVTRSSLLVTVPVLVPMDTLVMVPAPAAPTEPALLVIDTPDSDPPVTVPLFVPTVLLLICPLMAVIAVCMLDASVVTFALHGMAAVVVVPLVKVKVPPVIVP